VVTLVLGGARSGKSAVAERLAAAAGRPVTYVATLDLAAGVADGDDDLARRVAAHRARRPPEWRTVEPAAWGAAGLPAFLRGVSGTVLVDALGPWVACAAGFAVDTAGLCAALRERAGDSVVVSEEVGLGVHPVTADGRRFRDALGEVNQAVAAVADRVLLVVAGRVLHLEAPA
jgi:adenosyl cobinamide kinase/adenosyl cobinamide phosphate guanylyltransferase